MELKAVSPILLRNTCKMLKIKGKWDGIFHIKVLMMEETAVNSSEQSNLKVTEVILLPHKFLVRKSREVSRSSSLTKMRATRCTEAC